MDGLLALLGETHVEQKAGFCSLLWVRKDGQYTGVKKELRESQSLGMWNLSRQFSFRTYTDEFGAWISLCFQSYGLGRCSTDPCRLPRDVSSESTDYELFMKHCVDGEGWIIGDEWCDGPRALTEQTAAVAQHEEGCHLAFQSPQIS